MLLSLILGVKLQYTYYLFTHTVLCKAFFSKNFVLHIYFMSSPLLIQHKNVSDFQTGGSTAILTNPFSFLLFQNFF